MSNLNQVGDLVYGRLLTDNRTIEITMSCVDAKNMSSGMGLIKEGGFLMRLPVHFARRWDWHVNYKYY